MHVLKFLLGHLLVIRSALWVNCTTVFSSVLVFDAHLCCAANWICSCHRMIGCTPQNPKHANFVRLHQLNHRHPLASALICPKQHPHFATTTAASMGGSASPLPVIQYQCCTVEITGGQLYWAPSAFAEDHSYSRHELRDQGKSGIMADPRFER